MATPQRKIDPDPPPQLTDASDIISIDEVARRLDIPKTTLYG